MKRAKIIAKGKVQGVGFRFFVMDNAKKLGLCGYTRNLPDGTVETVVEGKDAQLDRLIEKIKEGPIAARVSSVEVKMGEAFGDYKEFEIRR
ncbi:MAG: acylphosphatase [Leptospiraceae bacterium]|nr:acylphosphatase [Leptospiraceae bacterium]MCP5499312.1 acylphosphatase [Leptospiraceae bacterium]